MPQAATKNITLSQSGPVAAAVQGDPQRIQQILINILANAVKFTPTGGRVTLSAAPSSDMVDLRVKDSGPGIPAELQNRIFEPFSQLLERTSGSEGVGLRLAISRTLRASGGDARVESEPGEVATFVVRLPRVE